MPLNLNLQRCIKIHHYLKTWKTILIQVLFLNGLLYNELFFFQYLICVFLVFLNFEPVHDIQNFLEPKDFSWGIMKVPYTKIFITCSRVPQIQYVGDSKYKLTFLKKDSQDFKNSIYLGFLWIRSKPGKQN